MSSESRKIRSGPDDQKHQTNKKECRKNHDSVDHFSLRNQVHELAGYQEALSAGDEQGHTDINGMMAKRNI